MKKIGSNNLILENVFLTGHAYLLAKRFMDLFLVVVSLPFWLPLIGIIALIIRITSPGAPVVFRQLRTGKGGRRFSYVQVSDNGA